MNSKNENCDIVIDNLINSLHEGVIICDKEDKILKMNNIAEAISGWQENEVIGLKISTIIHNPEVINNAINSDSVSFDKASGGKNNCKSEYYLATKEGNNLCIERRAKKIVNSSNEIIGSINIFRNIIQPINIQVLVKSIMKWAIELLGAHAGEIFLYDEQQNELCVVISLGYMEQFSGVKIKPGEGMAGRVFEKRLPLIVDDYKSWDGRSKEFDSTPPATTVMHVPLIWQDKCLGVLGVDADKKIRTYDESDIQKATLFGNLAAIAINNVLLHQELQKRHEDQRLLLEMQVRQRTEELSKLARRLEINAEVSHEISLLMDIDELLKQSCMSHKGKF